MKKKEETGVSYPELIISRITELRLKKNVSEYQMSYELGKSKGYVQSISSRKALPSMEAFLDICAYFGITPSEFFDVSPLRSDEERQLISLIENMSASDIALLLQIAQRFLEKGR